MPVHLIQGGFANTYLIEDGDSLAALDVGTATAANTIRTYLREQSRALPPLRMVTATHFHIDHVGGIPRIVHLFPDVKVLFAHTVGDYFQRKKKIALFPLDKWLKGLVPVVMAEENHLRNTVAALTSDRAAIPLPLLRNLLPSRYSPECTLDERREVPYLPHWELIATPGHTPDSICLYNSSKGILVSGDTILNMRGSGELNNFCTECEKIKESFQKLLPLKIRTVYPGHGEPLYGLNGLGNIEQWK
ncbi:MAG: MBL fold metallo-hydrolase [Deltaproteobacteria bacterium]|nr:MBL fold metallo-hydrolase [Deltaproteobacteria bacterium]MBW2077476.1 MBL fold metallo-hydrolase [Deltaproteobacteria bacterium]